MESYFGGNCFAINKVSSRIVFSYFPRNRDPKAILKARQNLLNGTQPSNSTPPSARAGSGQLHNALIREKHERNSSNFAGNRMNRFGGMFVVPSTVSSTTTDGVSVPQIIRNPVALFKPECARANIQKKRAKRSFTFSKVWICGDCSSPDPRMLRLFQILQI
jgi:hypothetical protein